MLLQDVVEASRAVGATRSRKAKTEALAAALRAAGPDEVETVTAYLSGVLRQRRTGLGWRSLTDLPPPAATSTLGVEEVHATLEQVSAVAGAGSRQARTDLVDGLFGRATAEEQEFLRRLVTGELRQGALDGLMLEAIAAAAEVSPAAVRRASMLCGATVPVAVAALTGGEEELAGFSLEVGRPLRPMLASSAPDLPAAVEKVGPGVEPRGRLQARRDPDAGAQARRRRPGLHPHPRRHHRPAARGGRGRGRAPRPHAGARRRGHRARRRGRPRPFQETAARTASKLDVATLRTRVPLTSYFFDLLHVDGEDLLDRPARDRFTALAEALPADLVVPRLVTADAQEAADYFASTVASGHEGVVVKGLDAAYDAGRRGASWVKVKPRHTLDLVVLAVEWGSGRRSGLLSNIHLGARDEDGGFVMLGKTFKGMTDEMLAWQTERFLELETSRTSYVVHVRPEQVVEVAFDGIQTSSRYPAGMALRFARVLRYRDDKSAAEADTITTVRSLHTGEA